MVDEAKPAKKPKGPKLLVGIFDLIPDDMDTKFEDIIAEVKEVIKKFKATVASWHDEELAYGLKKIVAHLEFFDNIEGGTQPIEDAISTIKTLQRVECSMVSNAKSD